jgi:uncharacterized caspase-like protein
MPSCFRPTLPACLLRAIAIAAACISVAHAQQEPSAPAVAGQERRVALVIGNAAYKNGRLANPVNDARAMAKKLHSLGFDVVLHEDVKTREIGNIYREFRSKVTPGGVALVFYAGHGVQFKGQNYFPAVDSDIASEEDVPLQSLNLGTLLDNMEEGKAGVSLVFLDACRDNPFARHFRSGARGLAKVEAASGTMIHYATKPGSVAADGEGQNGTYTEALLAQIGEPGVPVELMLKHVANRVVAKTKGKQEPWVEGSLRGDFYFIFNGPTTVNVQQAPVDPEGEAWKMAERADSIEALEAYLKEYPKANFAAAARIRLATLKKSDKSGQASSPAVAVTSASIASDKSSRASSDSARRFDGYWNVTVKCPKYKDGGAFTLDFWAQVKDGVLRGDYLTEGAAGWFRLQGDIQPDGSAKLAVKGLTGNPKDTVGNVLKGSPVSYQVEALFDGTSGTGRRVQTRPCELTFAKQ